MVFNRKSILLAIICMLFCFIGCEPVKVIGIRYKEENKIATNSGCCDLYGYTKSNFIFSLVMKYDLYDTIKINKNFKTVYRGSALDNSFIVFPNDTVEIYGKGEIILTFHIPRQKNNIKDTIYVLPASLLTFPKNEIDLDTIKYFTKKIVDFNVFRDKNRTTVSSNGQIKKIVRRNDTVYHILNQNK